MTSTAAAAAASTSPPPPPPPLFLPGDDDLLFSSGPGTDSASCLAALNSSLEWILQEPPPCLPLHPDAFISSLCSAVDSFLRFRRRPVNLLSIIAGCVDDGVDTLEAESLDRRVLAFYHWLLLKEKVLSFDLFFHFLSLMHAWARVRKRSCTPGKAWEGWVCRLFVCLFVCFNS